MGCGNRRDLFRILEYGLGTNRGFRDQRHDYLTHSNRETNLELLNKMFVSNLINEEEYSRYKRHVLDDRISFDELVRLQQGKKQQQTKPHRSNSKKDSKQVTKINYLQNSKDKLVTIVNEIEDNISELNKQKQKVELVLDEYIKHNEQKAEAYISKKINIEESIQNLKRKQSSLNEDLDDINQQVRMIEVKELELEATKLHDELTKFKNN